MIDQPRHLVSISGDRHIAGLRPVDHDNRQTERAGGRDLAVGSLATAVLRNDDVNSAAGQECDFIVFTERPTGKQVADVRSVERRIDGIDASNQIEMLRGGAEAESFLPANGEKDAAGRFAKCSDGFGKRARTKPPVALLCLPAGTFEPDQRYAGGNGGHFRIFRNLPGERMRGVQEEIETAIVQEIRKPIRTTETTGANRNRLWPGIERPAGKRQHQIESTFLRQQRSKLPRFGRPAQNKDAFFVHA